MTNTAPLTAKLGEFPGTAKLPPVPAGNAKAPAPKVEKNYKYLKPVFLGKLYDRVGSGNEVAEMVGVSGATISTALREDKVAMSIELAAQGIWERTYEERPDIVEKDGLVFVSMLIDKPTLKTLKPWLSDAGVNFKIFG